MPTKLKDYIGNFVCLYTDARIFHGKLLEVTSQEACLERVQICCEHHKPNWQPKGVANGTRQWWVRLDHVDAFALS